MYKIVSFRYESVIQKNFARLCRANFFLPPQSQIRSYGLGIRVFLKMGVTSRCVRRSVMSACGHNGTPGTSRCVRRSVMSAMDFHRSVVSACGHNGTTGTSRYVRRSVMSADNFRDSLYLEYTPSKTYFNTWFIKIKYGLDVYMTNF